MKSGAKGGGAGRGGRGHVGDGAVCFAVDGRVAGEGDGGPEDFIHSEMFTLIDKEGRIRGGRDKKGNMLTYDGTNILDVNRLIEDIAVLKLEYAK